MTVKIDRSHPSRRFGIRLRDVEVGQGLPPVAELSAELDGYLDILMGRKDAPIDEGDLTLMEVADAYFCRAQEIDGMIHEGERTGSYYRGGDYYKFRTGKLRSFLELSKKAAELGSRRITYAQMQVTMQREAQSWRSS